MPPNIRAKPFYMGEFSMARRVETIQLNAPCPCCDFPGGFHREEDHAMERDEIPKELTWRPGDGEKNPALKNAVS